MGCAISFWRGRCFHHSLTCDVVDVVWILGRNPCRLSVSDPDVVLVSIRVVKLNVSPPEYLGDGRRTFERHDFGSYIEFVARASANTWDRIMSDPRRRWRSSQIIASVSANYLLLLRLHLSVFFVMFDLFLRQMR